jgi:hypothetical protein
MRLRSSIALALAVLAIAGSASASLDRSGTWVPTASPEPGAPDVLTLINDGSFELGPPPASAWTEANSSTCERIGDWSVIWYVSSYHGYIDYWAGGYCDEGAGNVPITSSVTQTILVPAGMTELSFYYVALRPDPDDNPPDGDRAYVAVNGVPVWTLPLVQAANTYPDWTGPVAVDLAAYSGQNVALTFGGVSVGSVTGNLRFDYIELRPGTVPVDGSTWGALKALYR